VNVQRFDRLRRFEDPAAGIFEEFLDTRLGPGDALALLAGPLADQRREGWVVCSFVGPEHGNLRRLEALVARRLAAAGFPVLRVRPDDHPVHGGIGEIELAARLAEVEEAVEALRRLAGVETVGALGVLFGGTVAALSAQRLELFALGVVEPPLSGRQYLREAMRREAIAELMATEDPAPSAPGPMRELTETGRTTLRGLALSAAAFEQISAVGLLDDLDSFRGRSLLLGIAATEKPSPGLRRLAEHLGSLGGEVTLRVVRDALERPLGDYYYRNMGLLRIDTRLELDRALADATVAWARGEPVPGAAAGVA
jgi:hypothetical protein